MTPQERRRYFGCITYWESEKLTTGMTPAAQWWDRKIDNLADLFTDSGKPILKPSISTELKKRIDVRV